jgi:hypothetical protein
MKLGEVTQTLTALHWSTRTDEVGDKIGYFALPDRFVQVIYGIRKFRDDQQLEIMPSVSTEPFSKACETIDIGHGSYAPLIVPFKDIRVRVPEVLSEHVRQASDEAITWAQEEDLDMALRKHVALSTDAPGAAPVWHLAALAVLGDTARLKTYQASFEAGDRLGFVNYVTKDYIDRAVALAEGNLAKA